MVSIQSEGLQFESQRLWYKEVPQVNLQFFMLCAILLVMFLVIYQFKKRALVGCQIKKKSFYSPNRCHHDPDPPWGNDRLLLQVLEIHHRKENHLHHPHRHLKFLFIF